MVEQFPPATHNIEIVYNEQESIATVPICLDRLALDSIGLDWMTTLDGLEPGCELEPELEFELEPELALELEPELGPELESELELEPQPELEPELKLEPER